MIRCSSASGKRRRRASSVSTVYDGPGRSSSIGSTSNRGSAVTAARTTSSRASRGAAAPACLTGETRAGIQRTRSSSGASATSAATATCPRWGGSNGPPKTPMRGGRGVGRNASLLRPRSIRAHLVRGRRIRILREEPLPGLLRQILVPDLEVRLVDAQQGQRSELGIRIALDHELAVHDRRIVQIAPEVELPVEVVLLRELGAHLPRDLRRLFCLRRAGEIERRVRALPERILRVRLITLGLG